MAIPLVANQDLTPMLPKQGNCDARKRISGFCEACNRYFINVLSCLTKHFLAKAVYSRHCFETQPAYYSQTFLNFYLISARCLLNKKKTRDVRLPQKRFNDDVATVNAF